MSERADGGALPTTYEPHVILRWLYRRFFQHIRVDERWSDVVRDSARRGVVVYVMRSISFLDFLCLDYLVKQVGLPLVRFVNDLGLWILEPFGKGERRLRLRRQIPEDEALSKTVREKNSALLFLRKPPLLRQHRRGLALEVDLIKTLVETQRQVEEPILLVPQTFVWSLRPPRTRRTFVDLIFGPSEWPGGIRVLFQFLLNYRNALLRSGEPFDLRAFVAANLDRTDKEIADKVRYALLRRIERERTVVLGPSKKSPVRIREELLRSHRLRKHVEATARTTHKTVAEVLAEADADLRKLCAAPDPTVLALVHRFLGWVWTRIYDGLDVDREGLERMREAARHGTVVLLPSHKSHVDYVVLSDVLYGNAISTPLIAAGDNLSFWPLGPILRRTGGFFIRRSFKGKKLYSALVDAYMRKLMVEGFNIEFFIEGGRSRTGKLLNPKLGLLSMVVDAALELDGKPIVFAPISIGYERIIEEGSYVHEMSGGEKQAENIGGLLRTPKVLRSRYGRLNIQFGELLRFDQMRAEIIGTRKAEGGPSDLSPSERRMLVQRIAHRVTYEINRATMVTPAALVATALLAHRRRGMAEGQLLASARSLIESLKRQGARVAGPLLDEGGAIRADVLREAARLFVDGKLVAANADGPETIYSVPEERRLALEYYKNNVLHFFVPSALIASVIVAVAGSASVATLRERVQRLSRIFKYEFMFRADRDFDAIFDESLEAMIAAGELERMADHVRVAAGEAGARVKTYSNMLRTYFESYRISLRASELTLAGPVSRKEWTKRALTTGERMYLAGEIELRESLSRPKLETAILALIDHGVLKAGENDSLGPGSEAKTIDDLRALERQLAHFLSR